MAENLIANGNFWDGFNGYTKDDISYELKTYDRFFDYCEFKGNGQRWNRFYTYFKDGAGFVTGKTYRIGFWGRSDNSNSIDIGCNDDPLTFSLTPQWKWYESEYVSPLNQAISIINPDTTNTVCISGIWIQLGNDPIIPEVSPYIQTIELGNNQINLDSSQIEQGGSVGGPFGVDYSILKNSSSNNLFFIRLRSRNLYKIQTASRNVEITGDFTGFQLYVTEYDSEKNSIAYNGWHDNFKLKVRNDTRYISLLIRNSSDSTITPSQFIARGGVLCMNDYPILPIVTTPEGFEFAKGYNLLFNSAFQNGRNRWADWAIPPTREIVTVDNRNWLHVISGTGNYQGLQQHIRFRNGGNSSDLVGGMRMRVSYTCYVSQATMGKDEAGVGIHLNNSGGTIVAQYWRKVGADETSTTPKRYSFEFTLPSTVDRFNLMVGKCNGPNAIEAWFTDIMVEYISDTTQPLSDYRPNPADLVGGGVAYEHNC